MSPDPVRSRAGRGVRVVVSRRVSAPALAGALAIGSAAVIPAAAGGILPAGAATLTTISCGMSVTHSIVVANDLSCPVPTNPGRPSQGGTPPFGLVVMGQSRITIDLNGHTITGPRVPGPSYDATLGHSVEMTGVQLFGSSGVIVKNGTIRNFDAGLADTFGTNNNFLKLTVKDNHNYETVNGAVDYLPPSPGLRSVVATGTGTTTYSYWVATAQAPNPTATPGDNGTDGHSYTQDSLLSGPRTVSNAATLAVGVNSNTVSFTGVATSGPGGSAAYATGYRIIRSVNNGPQELLGTVPAGSSNTYTFVDSGQAPQATSYLAVSLANNNVSKDDTCDNGDGILIDASNHDVAANNTSTDNGPFSGMAMIGEFNGTGYDGSSRNTLSSNTISHNAVTNLDPGYNNPRNAGMNAYCGTGAGGGGMTRGRLVQDSGVRVEGPNATYNTIETNTVSGSGFNGIALHSFVCNSTGPQPNGSPNSHNLITGNTVFDTGKYTPAGDETNFDGIGWLASGPGTVVCVSPDNTVTGNVSYNNLRDGIYLGGRGNEGNTISGNTVNGNAANGIEAPLGSQNYTSPPTFWGVPTNVITQNVGHGNAGFDARDSNPNCAGDSWSADTFGTVNQACIQ